MDKKIFKLKELEFEVGLYLSYIIPGDFHESTYKTIKCSDIGKGDKSKFTITLPGFKLSGDQILYNLNNLSGKIKEIRNPEGKTITENTLRYVKENTIKCLKGEEVEINELEWLATTGYKKALNILSEIEPDDTNGIRREFKIPSKHLENLQGIERPAIRYGKTNYEGCYNLDRLIFIANPPKEKYRVYLKEWVEKGKPTKIISTPSKIEFC